MGELYRLCDFYRAEGRSLPDDQAEPAINRERGLWVIIFALVLLCAVSALFSIDPPEAIEWASNSPGGLHVTTSSADR